ncbi:MAG: cation-translocating P-type ATPase [Candidatus Shapirobacteria bacterium]|jgi:heavy metal translocating P-type ATPase
MAKINSLQLNILLVVLIIGGLLFFPVASPFISIVTTLPVLISALRSLVHKKITVDLLATFALTVSLLHHEWESAAFINLMITFARIFSIYTDTKARQGIASLLKLKPTTVKVKKGNQFIEVPVDSLRTNQIILVETGNRVAVDGVVIDGFASLDQSSLTGESLPVPKGKGDRVFSSTLNISGTLFVKATKIGTDTQFEKIISLMEATQNQKVGMKSIVDDFTTWYILATAFVSILVYLTTKNTTIVLSLLLVTCADDIAIAVPLSYLAGIARAAHNGVIIKGGIYLEGLAKATTLIVDKTGTLTKGQIKVLHIIPFNHVSLSEIIQISTAISSLSHHPLSQAITNYGKTHRPKQITLKKFQEVPGKGLFATDKQNNSYHVGNVNYLLESKIIFNQTQKSAIKHLETDGHNIVVISKNHRAIAAFGLGDHLRNGVKTGIKNIRELGIDNIVMLTGDNEIVAKDIATQIGITKYHASLLPQDKLAFIKNETNKPVIFVGDGVNDTAALAQADIGIAMGAIGSDSAIETADITLMDDDFSKIYSTIKLSRKVSQIVAQDFAIWATVNLIGLLLVFIFQIPPKTAAAYNFFSDFLPLFNSFRLLNYNFKR